MQHERRLVYRILSSLATTLFCTSAGFACFLTSSLQLSRGVIYCPRPCLCQAKYLIYLYLFGIGLGYQISLLAHYKGPFVSTLLVHHITSSHPRNHFSSCYLYSIYISIHPDRPTIYSLLPYGYHSRIAVLDVV